MKPINIALTLSLCLLVASMATAAPKKSKQYKKNNKEAVSQIVDGDHEGAITFFNAYLAEHPEDLESMYGLALAFTQKGDLDGALKWVQKAVESGLPFDRFVAGPRGLFLPLTETEAFRTLAKEHGHALIHGPMLGCVTGTGARFWVRTAQEAPVRVLVGDRASAPVRTDAAHDYTAVVALGGLKANTRYEYQLEIAGKVLPEQHTFRTFPKEGAPASFTVGFGGGAGFTPWYERMWTTIASHDLPAFLLLGDNVYIDDPTRLPVQQYCYYRRQSRPEYRAFTAATSIHAIWDDHDFTTNDEGGGPAIDTPAWKIPVWRVFRDNWNNASYGGGEKQPGCWFSFSMGDVDFFLLDGRYYRTTAKVDHPSMLGPAQKKWLFKAVKKSKATFKVIASPVPWSYGAKPGSLDPWQGYRDEREEIFSFLEKKRIDGVVLIAADRHRSDAWRIEREKGYDFYEFESSRLTNIHTHKIIPGSLFGYNETCSFGLLDFDTTKDDPEVTYRIISIDNEVKHTFTLKLSQLTHGKR